MQGSFDSYRVYHASCTPLDLISNALAQEGCSKAVAVESNGSRTAWATSLDCSPVQSATY